MSAYQLDRAIVVGQFMAGSGIQECNVEGDPMFVLTPPVAQFRNDYVFLTPPTYDTDYVNILAPVGSDVRLDGVQVAIHDQPVASSGFSLTTVVVSDGEHRLDADVPVGLVVYGTGGPGGDSPNVSYGYPGGLNLQPINIE